MRPRAQRSILAAALLALALGVWPSGAGASSGLDLVPCAGGFSCGTLSVPLERSGAVPGTIDLSVERRLAGATPAASAIVMLAGGPGQAALPFAEAGAGSMAPGLRTRDLIVFDQRGTGSSDPLRCPALEAPGPGSAATVIGRCAEQIGPARGAYTTQESVADIEAIREATGYQKLVLYGTSYGTKVALEYAERYPQHVEALVLDSVEPTDAPEPLGIPSLQAIPRVVEELCSRGACAGITGDPLGDLRALISRLRRHSLSGSVYDGRGRRHDVTMDELGLLDVLRAGDLNPALRALLPAAVHSALAHDPDPLLRLQALAEGLIPSLPTTAARAAAAGSSQEPDEALFFATSCEETPFPWQRDASSSVRLSEALAYVRAQPAAAFAPFDATTALRGSLIEACDAWPDASPPPPPQSPLPDVPTLILSGAQDLRTPTANAREVAALIPGSQLVVVPYTGHSVLGSDLTGCAAKAVSAFFSGQAAASCEGVADPLPPTPVTPTSVAALRAPAGLPGAAGRTLVAVLDTLVDLNRQVIAATLQADAELPSGTSFGGLHGGYARLGSSEATLHDFCLVPGVLLSGSFPVRDHRLLTSTIDISGSAAVPGTVRIGSSSRSVTGRLGGHDFDVSLAKVRLSRLAAAQWPATAPRPSPLARLGAAAEPVF